MKKSFITPLFALALILCLNVLSFADTIRLKDGSVIRGQVIAFKDQQFTVLIGNGSRGRRSRVTLYMEDVESIEFDSAAGAASSTLTNEDTSAASNATVPQTQPIRPVTPQPGTPQPSITDTSGSTPPPTSQSPASRTSPTSFQINVRVRGDNVNNGWTNSGLVVRRGQHLRISASGSVSLGRNGISTPAGIPTLRDPQKLMPNEPTGALIAVIGDDNDDFIFIGRGREFYAQRDGVLFLGVNAGNLNGNTGAYNAVIEADAASGAQP